MRRILIATPVKNGEHELPAFFASILRLTYPKDLLSVFFLESDSQDKTDILITQFMSSPAAALFAEIKYLRKSFGFQVPPETRHCEEVQVSRRKVLAEVRNTLLKAADLSSVDFVLWIDVDATGFPDSLVQDLLSVGKPVVAPHVVWEFGGLTYDRNSWLETHVKTFEIADGKPMFEGYDSAEGGRLYLDDFRLVTQGRFAQVPLHGVGTAVLLVNVSIHSDLGLLFPTTPYKRRLESEGFGLLAVDAGMQPVGLPNYEVKHVNHADTHSSFSLHSSVRLLSLNKYTAFLLATLGLLFFKRLTRALLRFLPHGGKHAPMC